MERIARKAGLVTTSVVLAGSGLLAAGPFLSDRDANCDNQIDAVAYASEATSEQASASPKEVRGDFSYTQEATSGNDYIKFAFCKAAAALCLSMPEYAVSLGGINALHLSSGAATTIADTNCEMESKIIGCACSTNGPGGGAMANAEVSGIAISTLAHQAGVSATAS